MINYFLHLQEKIKNINVNFRFEALHILRGFAAMSVCIFHTFYGNTTVFSSKGFGWLKAIQQGGGLGVQIFFMISGYCISVSALKNTEHSKKFLYQRLKRLYPAYWFSIVFGVFLLLLLMGLNLTTTSTMPEFSKLLKSLSLLVEPTIMSFNPSYWTLRHEIYFYLVVFLLLFAFKKKIFYALDFITFAFLLLSFNADIFGLSHIVGKFFIFDSWIYFYLGILLFRIICYFNKKELIYNLLLFYITYRLFNYNTTVIKIFTVLILIRPFDRFLKKIVILKPLFFLGTISYSLYLLHQFITPRMRSVLLDRLQSDWSVFLVLLFVLLPIALLIVYIFHLFFEKPFADHNINTVKGYKNYLIGLFKITFNKKKYRLFFKKVMGKGRV
ncbi:MAG: acyltransferase [Bacteroidetes bacterium]|nr:acyltransferase [Bacteroidota bacterium]